MIFLLNWGSFQQSVARFTFFWSFQLAFHERRHPIAFTCTRYGKWLIATINKFHLSEISS